MDRTKGQQQVGEEEGEAKEDVNISEEDLISLKLTDEKLPLYSKILLFSLV